MRVDFNVRRTRPPAKSQTPAHHRRAAHDSICTRSGRIGCIDEPPRAAGREKNPKYTLKPVADKLQELLGKPMKFLDDCVGAEVEATCAALQPGEVVLLENVRFHIEEEGKVKDKEGNTTKADPAKVEEFRASLTKLGDVYVNDAFGTAHRAHSSVTASPSRKSRGLPHGKRAHRIRSRARPSEASPARHSCGAKIADKFRSSAACSTRPMKSSSAAHGYTFRKVIDGMEIGDSLYDPEGAKIIPELMAKAKEKGVEIHLPVISSPPTNSPRTRTRASPKPLMAFPQAGRASMSDRRAARFSRR